MAIHAIIVGKSMDAICDSGSFRQFDTRLAGLGFHVVSFADHTGTTLNV